MAMRDRIQELRRVPASSIRDNPRNWRIHPESQVAAIKGTLDDIGVANAMIARETEDGLELIDGHLRRSVLGDQLVPVLVLDVTEEEADKLLLTLDPLAMMAHADQDKLLELLDANPFESEAVNAMLEALANGERDVMPDLTEADISDRDMGDAAFQVLVDCTTEAEQGELLISLEAEGFKCHSIIS